MQQTNEYTFVDRSTYLVAKKKWSNDFAAAISAVRQAKLAIKQAHRKLSPLGPFTWRASPATRDEWAVAHHAVLMALVDLDKVGKEINRLSVIRAEMRYEACRQMNLKKVTSTV